MAGIKSVVNTMVRWIALFAVMSILLSCASASHSGAVPGISEIAGTWAGSSVASCIPFLTRKGRCNAQQFITLDLFEGPTGGAGKYSCAYGNMMCLNANNSGKVVAITKSDDLTNIRVELPDGTSCLFSGVFQGNEVSGSYQCYGGGGIIEKGRWSAARAS